MMDWGTMLGLVLLGFAVAIAVVAPMQARWSRYVHHRELDGHTWCAACARCDGCGQVRPRVAEHPEGSA